MYYITYQYQLFWAQMALASLVPFQGPKKSRFSGPTPSNAPCNDVAPLKTITYRAIKTTVTRTLIVSLLWIILESRNNVKHAKKKTLFSVCYCPPPPQQTWALEIASLSSFLLFLLSVRQVQALHTFTDIGSVVKPVKAYRQQESGKWIWRVRESGCVWVGYSAAARQTSCYMPGMIWSHRGHHCRKAWTQGSFHHQLARWGGSHRGFEFVSFWSRVLCS